MDIQTPNLLEKYKGYFDSAAASVLEQHGISSEYRDLCDAAELLYYSNFPRPSKNDVRYHVVQFDEKATGDWVSIKWWDRQNGPVYANPNERLTDDEALKRYNSMNVGNFVLIKIVTMFEAKES